MKELYLLEIDNIIKRCKTWITQIEIERQKNNQEVFTCIGKLEIIINDLEQLARQIKLDSL